MLDRVAPLTGRFEADAALDRLSLVGTRDQTLVGTDADQSDGDAAQQSRHEGVTTATPNTRHVSPLLADANSVRQRVLTPKPKSYPRRSIR